MNSIKDIIRNSRLWGFYKAKIQEKGITKEFNYYENLYLEKFKTSKIDDVLILKNIHQKIKNKIVGNKIHFIYLIERRGTWEEKNIPPQIAKICSIDTIYLQDCNKQKLIDKIRDLKKTNSINIFLSCLSKVNGLDEYFFNYLDSHNIISMIFSLDDQHNFSGRTLQDGTNGGNRDIAKYIDICLTSSKKSIKKYLVEDGRVLYMPEGANIDIFKPLGLEKKYDVVFVGAVYGYRRILIDKLLNSDINIEVFSHGSKNGIVTFDEMIKIWNQSKIVLGHGGMGYSHNLRTLKGRDFEVPMCCIPYITTYYDELANIFEEDNEILFYKDIDDLVKILKQTINNKNKLENITNNLAKKREINSWEYRFRKILEKVNIYAS